MTHCFPSIAEPNRRAYTYDAQASYDGHAPISTYFRFYETYGDGLTQHSPTAPVPLGMLADYLFSLAKAMQDDKELIEAAGYEVRSGIASNRDIRFALGVVYKEGGKRRWFSRQERKLSTSDAKRHDRRYVEVTEQFDGTVRGAYEVLWQDHFNGIRMLGLAYSLQRYQREVLDEYGSTGTVAALLGWAQIDREQLESAYEAALAVIEAHDRLYQAARRVKHYEQQLNDAREAASQEVA